VVAVALRIPEYHQRLGVRIDEPELGDAEACIELSLGAPVTRLIEGDIISTAKPGAPSTF
jgi:hypothetical protein